MFTEVDQAKLSRDYNVVPLKRGEKINKEDLKYLFITLNQTLSEIALYFKCSTVKVKRDLRFHGITKSKEQHYTNIKRSVQAKYGVDSIAHVESVKQKKMQTCLERYGSVCSLNAPKIRKKAENTCFEHHGVRYAFQSEKIQNKAKMTLQKHYGVTVPTKSSVIANKLKKVHLVNYETQYNKQDTETYKNELVSFIKNLGLSVEFNTDGDILVPERKCAIVFNKTDKIHEPYFTYHIFNYEFSSKKEKVEEQLRNILQANTKSVYARKCDIREVNAADSRKFLEENHLQGYTPAKANVGLYYNGELVALMTFGKPRFNKKYEWELVRFCTKGGMSVVGGASKLFKYFVNNYTPISIISYSDIAKTRGKIYDILGFSYVGMTAHNYVWVNHNTVLSRYQCQKHLLIEQGFGGLGKTETSIMQKRGFVKVFDCGMRVHIWRIPALDGYEFSRDYLKFPLKSKETINKQDLEHLFFALNLSRDEIGSFLGTSGNIVRKWLHFYGLKKPDELRVKKHKAACLRKYGAETPLQVPSILAKTRATCKKRYGVTHVFKLPDVQERIIQTNLQKYGVSCVLQNPQIRKKCIATLKDKFGVTSGMQVHVQHPDIWYNDLLLTDFIKLGNQGAKWSTHELATYFNLSDSTVQIRIGELAIWSYITQNSSIGERELTQALMDLGQNVTKYKNKKLEFDVYIPEKQIAIEYNGNYWHSTRVRKDYKYHLKKTEAAKELGIFLYHVFEYEWDNKRAQVISQLKNLLGINENTIYARKCIIKDVDTKEASKFQNENHIQGTANACVKLGLYYNDQLVSLMTFGKSRFNKNVEWELVRFCSLQNTNVVGGASKLFKHFVKTYKPASVISYSDIAKTKGGIYDTLGFELVGVAEPNYVWVDHKEVLSRYKCQKHILIKQGFGHLGNTEREIMEARNFAQIFDCGTRVHIWRLK